MARLPRAELVDPLQIECVHVINRTVRRCFLLGDDQLTGKNYDHRKVWIEELLQQFAANFGIELLCYSILSNHSHQILRSRPDVVETWDDTEVARRWLMICPRRKTNNEPAIPSEAELNSIRANPEKLAEIRRRLSDVSWWMRLLNQRIAQRANREEGATGHFWQDRFRCTRLCDEESLLACAAYVELNPIRAGICERIEDSDFTSVQRRIEQAQADQKLGECEDQAGASRRRDSFLANLTLGGCETSIGPVPARSANRCSDKGFLDLELEEYLKLLDWTARQVVTGSRNSTPPSTPGILQRLGLECESWLELITDFNLAFYHIAGRSNRVDAIRSHLTRHRFRLRPLARRLLPSVN